MRLQLIIVLTTLSLSIFSQTGSKFVFFDACKNEVVELPYTLFIGKDSTSQEIEINTGEPVNIDSGIYLIGLFLTFDEMVTTFYFHVFIDKKLDTDTLFLERVRFYGPSYIHANPEEYKFYCCEKLCDGFFEETDLNGIIRFRGKFKNGVPKSNLKYYDKFGKRIRTVYYVNGRYIKMKFNKKQSLTTAIAN